MLTQISRAPRSTDGSLDWDGELQNILVYELEKFWTLSLGWGEYNSVHFALVAEQLLSGSSYEQGVNVREIISILGDPRTGVQGLGKDASQSDLKKAGKRVLQSLVKADAVTLRLRKGIPTNEGEFAENSMVVCAPSALSFYCLMRLKPDIEKTLKVWRDGLSKVQEDLASPSSSLGLITERIRVVENKIECVSVDILSVEKEIAQAKSIGDGMEVQALRREKEQLRRKEEQLLEMKILMMREVGSS